MRWFWVGLRWFDLATPPTARPREEEPARYCMCLLSFHSKLPFVGVYLCTSPTAVLLLLATHTIFLYLLLSVYNEEVCIYLTSCTVVVFE